MHRVKVRVVEDALDANNTIARANRDDFDRDGVTVVNLMSAPGAGKTTLLERVLGRSRACAWGCSRATCRARSTPTGSPTCTSRSSQLNTDHGFGGECHLDANMVRSALPVAAAGGHRPADDRERRQPRLPGRVPVGEDARIMVSSVAEGEDKPLKYPLMFRACELVVLNKLDLLPHLDFDLDKFLHHLDAVHPSDALVLLRHRSYCWGDLYL